jgi:hypothetical protein
MTGTTHTPADSHRLRGPIDRPVLITIRDIFNRNEPLSTATLDEFLDPSALIVEFVDGLGEAESARIDVAWTTKSDYTFHYTDAEGVNVRWGNHPHHGDYSNVPDTAHFHPPPDASSDPQAVEASCITQSSERLVTLAVLKLWRTAYHSGSLTALNAGHNPP